MKKLLILFAIATTIAACNNNNNNNNNTNISLTDDLFYSGTMDGVSEKLVQTPTSGVVNSVSNNYDFMGPQDIYTYSSGFSSFNGGIAVELYRGHMIENDDVDSLFFAMYKKGAYNFVNDISTQQGFVFKYFDANGDEWATNKGSGNQTGSSIIIEDVKNITIVETASVIALIKFNCKVYNDAGQSKTLTNGVWLGVFEEY